MIKPIILETEDKCNIFWRGSEGYFYSDLAPQTAKSINSECKGFDTILIDTEAEIVEGDLYYDERDGILTCSCSAEKVACNSVGFAICHKIISSTSKSHLVDYEGYEKYTARKFSAKVYLPQLSPNSMQQLINYYNEYKCMPESVETEVEETNLDVELKAYGIPKKVWEESQQIAEYHDKCMESEEKLYTKEEVIDLIKKHRKETYNGYSSSKWIKENLV